MICLGRDRRRCVDRRLTGIDVLSGGPGNDTANDVGETELSIEFPFTN